MIAILVVDNLFGIQESPNALLHYDPVLSNIPGVVCKRMIFYQHKNIAILVYRLATFPISMLWTRLSASLCKKWNLVKDHLAANLLRSYRKV